MTRLRDPFAASFGRNFPERRLWTNIQHFFLPSLFPDASQLPNRLGELRSEADNETITI
jgi:hypothetical protein